MFDKCGWNEGLKMWVNNPHHLLHWHLAWFFERAFPGDTRIQLPYSRFVKVHLITSSGRFGSRARSVVDGLSSESGCHSGVSPGLFNASPRDITQARLLGYGLDLVSRKTQGDKQWSWPLRNCNPHTASLRRACGCEWSGPSLCPASSCATLVHQVSKYITLLPPQGLCACCYHCLECSSSSCLPTHLSAQVRCHFLLGASSEPSALALCRLWCCHSAQGFISWHLPVFHDLVMIIWLKSVSSTRL